MGDITESFKVQYADNLEMLVSTPGYQPDPYFTIKRFDGKAYYADQIGGFALQPKSARAEQLPIVDPAFRRRKLTMATRHARSFVDQDDKLQQLLDPTSSYLGAYADACKVTKWLTAINGAIGTAYQGNEDEGAEEAVPLPSSQTLDLGGSGFTFAKLKLAKKLLRVRGGLRPGEKPIVLWTTSQEDNLMDDDKVASSEYNNQKVLVDGSLKYFFGCQFELLDDFRDHVKKTLTNILPKTGTTRSAIMFAKSAVLFGMPASGRNTEGRIDWDTSRQCNQASAAVRCGATRINDYGVIVIPCAEEADEI